MWYLDSKLFPSVKILCICNFLLYFAIPLLSGHDYSFSLWFMLLRLVGVQETWGI